MMAAAVTKMSRIIQHVGSGEKGTHVLQKLQARTPCSSAFPPPHRCSALGMMRPTWHRACTPCMFLQAYA